MTEEATLSKRQQKILDVIREFDGKFGYPPSIRQIGEATGISSTSVVSYNLDILTRKGYMTRDREVSRGLRLVGEPQQDKPDVRALPRPDATVMVPLVGFVRAGDTLILPDSGFAQAETEYIAIPTSMVKNTDKVYALQVRGTSMIDALVDDGDVVLIRQQTTAESKDMVAAWLREEKMLTLKYFFREKGGAMVRLQPANPLLDPIYSQADNVEIQGKVVGVIRRLD
jgi:repressor LexA